MTDQHAAATYLPPAKYTRSDGAITCPHAIPVAPGSCEYCWDLHEADCGPCWEKRLAAARANRRRLTELEHDAAWHAIEGTAAEEGADPGTVLNAVLHALDIDPPQ